MILCCLMTFSACVSREDPPRPEPPPLQETVFREVVGTMDKARSVEDTTMQRTQELDEALEKSETP